MTSFWHKIHTGLDSEILYSCDTKVPSSLNERSNEGAQILHVRFALSTARHVSALGSHQASWSCFSSLLFSFAFLPFFSSAMHHPSSQFWLNLSGVIILLLFPLVAHSHRHILSSCPPRLCHSDQHHAMKPVILTSHTSARGRHFAGTVKAPRSVVNSSTRSASVRGTSCRLRVSPLCLCLKFTVVM